MERLYGPPRAEEVENAADSVVQYAEWKKNPDPKILKDLRDYNEKDCQVTEGLHHFLLTLPETQELPYRANKWGTSAKPLCGNYWVSVTSAPASRPFRCPPRSLHTHKSV